MSFINKDQADQIYNLWCSSEDARFTFKGELFGLEYNDSDKVCYVDEDGGWVSLEGLLQDDIDISIADWVFKSVNTWKV